MTGTGVMLKTRHKADKKLSDAVAEGKAEHKGSNGYDKTATLVKAPEEEGAAKDMGAAMRPTDEQLSRINQFTRELKTADEVVAFKTLSANDLPDRDDDRFVTDCVKGFAELPQPFSPIGKSFLADHNYKMDSVRGRIFGAGTEKISGSLFLTNEVYVPNTEKNAGYIEDLNFGLAWAVSVGVMLGKSECSVCQGVTYWYFCENGHEKGLWYEKDGDEDKYGWPIPVDPTKNKSAVKALREFSEPIDMYELSQVILGAQYFAALDKLPDFASVMKSATDAGIPTIGLSADEAKELPFKHEPLRVAQARQKGTLKTIDDGSLVWTEGDLVFTFDPENPETGICSLGRTNNKEEGHAGSGEVPGREGSEDLGDDAEGLGVEGHGVERSGEDQPAAELELEGSEPGAPGSLSDDEIKSEDDTDPSDEEEDSDEDDDSESEGDGDDDEEKAGTPEDSDEDDDEDPADPSESDEEEKAVTKKAVQAFANAHKSVLPESVIEAVKEAPGNGLDVLVSGFSAVIEELRNKTAALEPKAALGDEYLGELREDALHWYTVARSTTENPKVPVESFEKLLNLASGDPELLKSMADEQRELAQAKFPGKVRRSSFPSDPNVSEGVTPKDDDKPEVKEADDEDRRIRRRHA
jgi:hypothetical protein